MKKIIIILFLFLSCYICYYIYSITEDNKKYFLLVGDNIANNPYLKEQSKISIINTDFINKDYRIIDILNIIKYNQEITINKKSVSIHQLLKKSDVIIISIGMNDIYYKLNDNTKEIYTYLNNVVNNYELILKEINRYKHKEVIVLGYYNITNKNNDLYTYTNYKIKRITNNYNYTFIDLNKIIHNNPKYLKKTNNFYLNNEGYKQINKLIVENLKIS